MKKQFDKPITPKQLASQKPQVSQSPSAKTAVTHDDIAKRAYEIYVKNGCVKGHCCENWQQAEQELKQELKQEPKTQTRR